MFSDYKGNDIMASDNKLDEDNVAWQTIIIQIQPRQCIRVPVQVVKDIKIMLQTKTWFVGKIHVQTVKIS